MASIFDRLLNLRPQGLPAVADNAARVDLQPPETADFRFGMTGLGKLPSIHPVNPYKPSPSGGSFPPVHLSGRLVPPNRRNRLSGVSAFTSPGRALGTTTAPGVVGHPGRRLGRTGNPNAPVGKGF